MCTVNTHEITTACHKRKKNDFGTEAGGLKAPGLLKMAGTPELDYFSLA